MASPPNQGSLTSPGLFTEHRLITTQNLCQLLVREGLITEIQSREVLVKEREQRARLLKERRELQFTKARRAPVSAAISPGNRPTTSVRRRTSRKALSMTFEVRSRFQCCWGKR